MNTEKTKTLLETLTEHRDAAQKLADSAAMTIDMMTGEPAIVVAPGKYYHTYDGSLIYITKRTGACKCPVCTGVAREVDLGPFRFLQAVSPEEQEQHKSEEVGERYDAVILTGGHGLEKIPGTEPGEVYQVGVDGYICLKTVFEIDPKMPVLHGWILAMAGLSLRRESIMNR